VTTGRRAIQLGIGTTTNLGNGARALAVTSFARYYRNSVIIAVAATLGPLVISALAGFAFARLRFPGRNKLFLAYPAPMMFPSAVTMVPLFIPMTGAPGYLSHLLGATILTDKVYVPDMFHAGRTFGIDSCFMITVPRLFSPFGVSLIRQFFLAIRKQMHEAAAIDGGSTFQPHSRGLPPLATPALGTLAILTFTGTWGECLWPLLITNADVMGIPPPIGIASLLSEHATDWPLIMAAATMMIVPMVSVFSAIQRCFVSAILMGAVEG